MEDKLQLSPDQIRSLGREAVEWVARYYNGLRERRVFEPTTSAELRQALREPLPQEGAGFESLLAAFDSTIARFSRHNGHPRFFGYIASPGVPVAALAALLEATLNVNVTSWRSAPAATEIERLVIEWLKEMIGYPAGAGGLLVSGGSMANFAALAAKAPCNVARDGVAAAGRTLCLYVSEDGHFSVSKAAAMLGLGERAVRSVPTDALLRLDTAALDRMIEEDLAAGHLPFCVVANAGTTATGAIDPIPEIAAIARRRNLWLHVDAAYGGFAALAPSARSLFAGIAEADSIALDPHKWLYLPVGCGCVLYKDPATAHAAFGHAADYIRTIGLENDEAYAFWDYGPELSRPFRALPFWMLMKSAGARALGEAVERNIGCARHFEALVKASADFEMLAPVTLSVFCFRYATPGYAGDLDALNERVLIEVQHEGSTYLSNARVRGRFALRGCVLNYRTTKRDMEIALDDVRRAALRVAE